MYYFVRYYDTMWEEFDFQALPILFKRKRGIYHAMSYM